MTTTQALGGPSKIQWTNRTWSPITGCSRVSPGCDHCYMFAQYPRLRGMHVPGYEATPDTVILHPERLQQPLHWRKPQHIFVCSMSDLFHPSVPWDFVREVFTIMMMRPQHTFQVLTKRPGRMAHFANRMNVYRDGWTGELTGSLRPWPPNVWAGTSVESAKYLPRLDVLARVPAPVRFVSVEPMLGQVDLRRWIFPQNSSASFFGHLIAERPVLQWVIVGGESGPGARPVHPDWVRSIRDQCQEARTPYFFKQWGEWAPEGAAGLRAAPLLPVREHRFPEPFCRVYRWGKRAAGALLDGREWREMPS